MFPIPSTLIIEPKKISKIMKKVMKIRSCQITEVSIAIRVDSELKIRSNFNDCRKAESRIMTMLNLLAMCYGP